MTTSGSSSRSLALRASQSILATDDEIGILESWLVNPAAEEEHLIVQLADRIGLRESGIGHNSSQEVLRLGSTLDSLENELTSLVESRIKVQRGTQRHLRACLTVSAAALVAVSVGMTLALISGNGLSGRGEGSALIVFTLLVLSIVFARLYQLSSEAAERLDERLIAVRFLRLSLSDYLATANPEIVQSALHMFVGFHGSKSPPFGPDDISAIARLLRRTNESENSSASEAS